MAEGDALPEQIRRAAARAEELQRELAEQNPPTEEVLPAGGDTTGSEQGGEPPPVHPPEGEPAAAPPTGDWEQRYRTLQGKYDTEIPALRAQVQGMERLIAQMQHPPAPPAAELPKGPLRFEEGDVDIYGQDFLEAAARAAAARYEPVIARLENKIKQLEGGQTNLSAENLQNRLFTQLDNDPELAGWREVNTDPAFIQWLQELDEYAGIPRNQMLQHAYANGDAVRTGRFFKRYMSEHTAPRTAVRSPQTDLLPRPNGNGQMVSAGGTRLEDMVVPGRASRSGGSGDGAQNPRIWSRPEITRFYRERTEGKWRGREQESEALERDILAASSEGRIVH